MKPNLVNSVSDHVRLSNQAGNSMPGVVMEEPCYEFIRKMNMKLTTECSEVGEEYYEVEDPIQETAVVIEITINQYTTTQSLDVPAAAAELTLVNTTTPYFYFLEGFLEEDDCEHHQLDELNSLVRDKIVNPQNLEKIKRFVLSYSSRIKEVALELRRADLCIEMEFDLVRRYGTHEDSEEHSFNDMFRMEFDDNEDDAVEFDEDDDEDMFDIDDDSNNDVRKPALQSSVEALETRKFETKEDLELMMKSSVGFSRSCMVCMDEFSIDVEDERTWIKTMPCRHVFHKGCIDKWLEKRYTCPICRYAMPTAD